MASNPDFIINSTPLGTYYSPFGPAVATLADGTALVAWVSFVGESSSDTEIRARWLNPDGTPASDDFQITSTAGSFGFQPVATVTAGGKVLVAWDNRDGGGISPHGLLLDPLALPKSAEFAINAFGLDKGTYNGDVAVTALSDGRVFALWTSEDGGDGDGLAIRGRFLQADGTPASDDLVLNTTGTGAQYDPNAAALSDGRVLLTYASTDAADGTEGCLRGRVIGADGAFKGDDFLINSTPGGYQNAPDVTALADGRALVVWFSSGLVEKDPEGGNPLILPGEVRARVIGADGQPEGADFQVNSTALDFSYAKPTVATLADGRALVIWHSGDAADGDWGTLRGRVIGADGAALESDFPINTTPINNQSSPDVAALVDGRVLISWTSDDGVTTGPVTRGVYLNPDIGTTGADRIAGSAGADIQMGLGGNDRLSGGKGDDQMMGGTGRDVLNGGAGADVLDGGTDRDVLKGGDGNDWLGGGSGADMLDGGTGKDLLLGGTGTDTLSGGAGSDVLKGGTGDDHLSGGAGNDVLGGGTGADVFVFASSSGHDRITDFGAADRIEIDGSLWSGTAADFVTDHASVTAQGVLISLSADSDILLLSLTRTDGLAEALQFG